MTDISKLRQKTTLLLLVCFLLGGVAGLVLPAKAKAFTPTYNQSNLIDNGTFLNKDTMTASQIQTFLNNVGSGIKNYSDTEKCSPRHGIVPAYKHCNQKILAAQIIYDAAQVYSVNPRAILANLQKEEGLITSPNPTSSQITYAMGYGCPDSSGCSGYSGFFNQVDWGSWQFRVDVELNSGRSWWGYTPASYPCSGSTNYYSPGLLPGNTVSFKDDYGTIYKTFKLNNAATAALYCYTPHAYPGSSKEYYSGSYWFVYYYQKWFGSTQSTTSYGGIVESANTYSDSGRTNKLTSVPTVTPGAKYYMQISARNIGYQSWSNASMRVGTSDPRDRSSQFQDTSWINAARPAAMTEATVGPGDAGTFNFTLKAPSQTGSYKECFGLVAESVAWVKVPDVCFNLNVVAPVAASNSTNIQLNSSQSLLPGQYLLSPDTESVLILQPDGNLVLYTDFKPVWNSHTSGKSSARLDMQGDGNLVIYDKDNKPLWQSKTNNNSGASLKLQSDGNLVIYSSTSSPLWNTATVHNPGLLSYVNSALPVTRLYTGQSLVTADRRFHLVLQPDGNLVLYSPNRATWHTKTNGKNSAYLAMQSDGNLVLYDKANKPLWTSKTSHTSGSSLVIQPDGNLVIYDTANKPLWSSHTNGVE